MHYTFVSVFQCLRKEIGSSQYNEITIFAYPNFKKYYKMRATFIFRSVVRMTTEMIWYRRRILKSRKFCCLVSAHITYAASFNVISCIIYFDFQFTQFVCLVFRLHSTSKIVVCEKENKVGRAYFCFRLFSIAKHFFTWVVTEMRTRTGLFVDAHTGSSF